MAGFGFMRGSVSYEHLGTRWHAFHRTVFNAQDAADSRKNRHRKAWIQCSGTRAIACQPSPRMLQFDKPRRARTRARVSVVEFWGFSARPATLGTLRDVNRMLACWVSLLPRSRLPLRVTGGCVARHVGRPRVRSKNAYIDLVTAFRVVFSVANSRPRRTRASISLSRHSSL